MKLNEEQMSAVNHLDGVCLITAVPGSGKTATLTARVTKLIKDHGISPSSILCLTFTNKAANEMRERIAAQAGATSEKVWMSTFHSLCTAILRRFGKHVGLDKNFTIYAESDQRELLTKIARMQGLDSKWTSQNLTWLVSSVNNFREDIEDFEEHVSDLGDDEREVITSYLSFLDKYNATDFSGILYKTWLLFQKKPAAAVKLHEKFKYILVDEMQDTNTIQYEIVKRIVDPHSSRSGNLFAVGDFNQSIFSWRGARPENIEKIRKDFDDVMDIVLPRNYRSTESILLSAQNLIRKNEDSGGVTLSAERGSGESVKIRTHDGAEEEAVSVANAIQAIRARHDYDYKDFAVLYRINSLSKTPEMVFRKCRIPYKIVGGFSFYDRAEIKTSIAYLSVVSNPHDTISFARAVSSPSRGVGEVTIGNLESYCERTGVDILEACKSSDVKMTQKARKSLNDFVGLIERARSSEESLAAVASSLFVGSGYYDHIKKVSKTDADYAKRIDNVDSLLSGISDFQKSKPNASVSDYLQSVQLLTDDGEDEDNAVTLQTMHSAKGLEYPVVFIIGAEESICPHARAVAERGDSEERRLFYVAVTRAEDQLYINYCNRRKGFSTQSKSDYWKRCKPSRFLGELLQ